ncbi:unnamed protein product [Cyprideis torosa]|uniref:VTT domain-containing protein n=1 Tax=Cyprideis torosa TaxID=163714 RepID=A0A7R8ZI83_9CRUS|nr:unnamed protein product [Cyprideis torosa]CAG0879400.1 unnamed protein product [Cyprideis torosa]
MWRQAVSSSFPCQDRTSPLPFCVETGRLLFLSVSRQDASSSFPCGLSPQAEREGSNPLLAIVDYPSLDTPSSSTPSSSTTPYLASPTPASSLSRSSSTSPFVFPFYDDMSPFAPIDVNPPSVTQDSAVIVIPPVLTSSAPVSHTVSVSPHSLNHTVLDLPLSHQTVSGDAMSTPSGGSSSSFRATDALPPPSTMTSSSSSPSTALPHPTGSTRRALFILVLIFAFSALSLFYVYLQFPHLDEDEWQYIKLPRDIEDAKKLGNVLSRYKEKYWFEVLSGVFLVYIFLQTFAIPGSIFLSILTGFLFPFPLALFLVCFCSATGASFCYLLSFLVGRRLVYRYFPDKAREWSQTVNRHRDNLFNYMLFLRITPFLPNWFINITAPVIDVPLSPFFVGTFFGVAPPSFVAIQAGTTLHKLTSSSDALSLTSISILAAFAILSLLPIFFKNRLREKFE